MPFRAAITALLALLLLVSCDTLKGSVATSGPKRYKSEVSANLLEIKSEIDQGGEVKDGSYRKLEKIMTNWKEEMGGKQSYIYLTEMKEHIDSARADPNVAFREYQEASLRLSRVLDTLKTEVQ